MVLLVSISIYVCIKRAFEPKRKEVNEKCESGKSLRFGRGVDGVERMRRDNNGGAGANIDDGSSAAMKHWSDERSCDPCGCFKINPQDFGPCELVNLVEEHSSWVSYPNVVYQNPNFNAFDPFLDCFISSFCTICSTSFMFIYKLYAHTL